MESTTHLWECWRLPSREPAASAWGRRAARALPTTVSQRLRQVWQRGRNVLGGDQVHAGLRAGCARSRRAECSAAHRGQSGQGLGRQNTSLSHWSWEGEM